MMPLKIIYDVYYYVVYYYTVPHGFASFLTPANAGAMRYGNASST